ncbi:hypothetical protein F5Y17DRAFT_180857 [Xylariaceae sp. FL0594]|nr:hypothetical protein F5Y17DRAFT_180857 [Xylariaceae sp. FL0594]
MVSPRLEWPASLTSLTVLVTLLSFPGTAAILEHRDVTASTTGAIRAETDPPNPWPTDTIYTFPSEKATIITTTLDECLLSAGLTFGDPGYRGKNCFFTYTTTETRTLTVGCEGCDGVTVRYYTGGCPKGGTHHPTSTIMTTPDYKYAYVCAPTPSPTPT